LSFAESTLTLSRALWLLSPELLLLSFAVLILILDVALKDKRWVPYVTMVGLFAALIAAATQWGIQEQVFFVLSLDNFSVVVKLIALMAMIIVVLISEDYMQVHTEEPALFHALLLFSTISICLLGASTNLLMIFLVFDFLSIVSYILTAYVCCNLVANEAAFKYFMYGSTLSAVMLYGFSWLYGLTGVTDLSTIAQGLFVIQQRGIPSIWFTPLLILIVAGLSYKVAAAPFHQWAPDAYEGAPTPVAAFFSVAPKIAGFALFVRVTEVLFPVALELGVEWRWPLLAFISAFAMTFGNLAALAQENVKRLMAYSSIAQAGYVLIGVTMASERGVTAVLLYLLAYALTNLGAFAVIIAYENRTGARNIADYAGAYQRAPFSALVMTVCLLSLAGIPGTAGFMGKLWLFAAAVEGNMVWLAALGVLNSIISLAYYWKIIRAMYIAPSWTEEPVRPSPLLYTALGLTLGGVLLVGIFPSIVLPWFQSATQTFFGG